MFFITNKIDFFFMYSLIMESLLRQIFEQFDLRDPSNHIKAIIQTYCSPINVVAFFTIENGCKGTVHASFTNISSQYDENEENKENKGRVVLQVFRVSIFQTIFILFYIIIIFSLQKCNINLYPSYINELINKIPKHILYIIIIIYLICILCTIYYLYNLTYSNYFYYTDIWVFILIIEIFILIIILILKNCNNEYLNNLPIFNTFKNITNKMENLLRLNSYDDLKKK